MNRYIVVSEEAGTKNKSPSSNGSQNRDPTSGTPQHISTNGESSSTRLDTGNGEGPVNSGKDGGEPSKSFSNIDRGQPRKCPSCTQMHYGASQLGIFCCECEHDKIKTGQLDLPEKPQYSDTRETW